MSARSLLPALGLSLLGSTSGCKNSADKRTLETAAESAPSASSSQSSALAAASVVQPAPWFFGEFAGQYEAKVATVELKLGAPREWKSDDGKLSSGPGKLTLQIDANGNVHGASDGALGAGTIDGKIEDDTLRAELSPIDGTGLHGVLVASRVVDGFKGSIRASTMDSLRVRQATIELKKQVN
jgi:hypothetical protein